MQLILCTETSVDIKAKMSLNDDNLEKSTMENHSAVANGDVANGDLPNDSNGAGESNKKLEQVKQIPLAIVADELEQVKTMDASNNSEIETSQDNEVNQAIDIVNGIDSETVEDNPSIELAKAESEHINNDIAETEVVPVEEVRNDKVNDNTVTKKNHESSAHIEKSDANENVITEKENTDIVVEIAKEESTVERIVVSDISDVKKPFTMETDDTVNTESDLNDEDSAVTNIPDTTESVTIEKENNDVDLNTETDISGKIAAADITVDYEENSTTMETDDTVSTEVDLNDEDSAVTNIPDATESVTTEKENNDVDLNTKTDISGKIAAADITVDYEENSTTSCNVNDNEDASSNNTVDNGNIETVKIPEANQNVVNSKIEEKETDSGPIENIIQEGQESDVDMMPEIDSTVNTTDGEDRKDIDESIISEMGDKEVQNENVLITDANSEKEQNIPVSAKQLQMETDEVDMNDENIQLKDLNNKIENVDVLECVKKALEEEEERQMLDIEKKEYLKTGNDDITRKLNIMDVDESAENVSITLEANSKTTLHNLSDVNKTSENTVNFDCSITEPISVLKDKTVDLIPDSSDDVIFNLDDDKEQENETVERSESESTKIIEEDNKTVSASDNDKKETDTINVPKESDKIIDLDENMEKEKVDGRQENTSKNPARVPKIPPVLKLSNTLDILSDEEDESKETNADSKCISIEDDDDVMLIDEEDTCVDEKKTEPTKETETDIQEEPKPKSPVAKMELNEESVKMETEPTPEIEVTVREKEVIPEKIKELSPEKEISMPLLHEKFLKSCKKNLSEMTREELEEFCILKIVESVIDRSSLSEVKTKLKTLTQNIDEYNKKAKMLTKQNRDLQVVLKSIQEDQKKGLDSIVPLKITRSVGMQVLMTDKVVQRRKGAGQPANAPVNKQIRNPVIQSPRPQKQQAPQIPVPRLVPANNPTLKSPNAQQPNTAKITSPLPNGVKAIAPVQKGEKRTHNRIQSVTVDLTDDEPPAKVVNRAQAPTVPPVRLVPSQNLLAPPRPSTVNSPRKVYIPISGPQAQNVRPGQTIMLKTVPNPSPRQRCPPPHMVRMPQSVRIPRPQGMRHPAPLPDCMKQYQPPNWKALPPAPDLKLAKVENGIVISWKIEGYQEDSYEEIASYQLYAYQETASPPNTALWKKIGDVKALPLPMACTLTQFMAGYKYYFAVRAVDIRSRLGPFSLPGSILLLNKM